MTIGSLLHYFILIEQYRQFTNTFDLYSSIQIKRICFLRKQNTAVRLEAGTTSKHSLKELEDMGLILWVRWSMGEPNRIYTLRPKKDGCRDE